MQNPFFPVPNVLYPHGICIANITTSCSWLWRVGEREASVCVCVCVCERERDRKRERVCYYIHARGMFCSAFVPNTKHIQTHSLALCVSLTHTHTQMRLSHVSMYACPQY